MNNYYAIIDGKEITDSKMYDIISPITLEPFAKVSALQPNDIDCAFEAARKSQKEWAKRSINNRIKYIREWNEKLAKNRETIAGLMAKEIGKSFKESLSEVDRTIEYSELTISAALEMSSKLFNDINNPKKIAVYSNKPRGVVLAISPFNYPINLALSKIVPALIMGNSVVFKPATNGSVTGLYFAKLLVETGIPNGVFNVITGRGRDIGNYLVQNKHIDLIMFTGSVGVGKNIQSLAPTKECIFELGGKDPAIVFNDANLDNAADQIISGAFSYSGQRCTAIKRVLVSQEISQKLVDKLKTKLEKLTVGNPFDNCDITPMITLKAANYVDELISDAVNKGATIVGNYKKEANLLTPTIMTNVTKNMRIAIEEQFGPTLPVISFKTKEEALEIANNSEYGLQAAIFSENIDFAYNFAENVEAGTVQINSKTSRGPDVFPFLGIKNSGVGVQGVKWALESVTIPHGIVFNWKK